VRVFSAKSLLNGGCAPPMRQSMYEWIKALHVIAVIA